MAFFNQKISNLVTTQLPEFVVEDHPKFVEFLKAYYTFMEASLLEVTDVQTTDGIQLESQTGQSNLLLLDASGVQSEVTLKDAGEKLIYESSSYGKFTIGEIIQGQTSGATSTVLSVDINLSTNTGKIFILAQDKFLQNEIILGLSSNASAVINTYKPNPVTNIQQLLNLRDVDNTLDSFLTHFRYELLNTLPEGLQSNVNKKSLLKNAYYLYNLKGTSVGNDIFFRILFNEKALTTYPRDNILRASDGIWKQNNIIRVLDNIGDTYNLINRQIYGIDSFATAIVESITKIIVAGQIITELVLDSNNINGTFIVGETVRGTATDTDDNYIFATVQGIPTQVTITDSGSLYNLNELIDVNTGNNALIETDILSSGSIDTIIIDNSGSNYKIGDQLIFNNINSTGNSAAGFVRIVNGGIANQDNSGTRIILEDATTDGDNYAGNVIVQETASGSGDITDIFISNPGLNYTSLPSITISSSSGVGAKLKCYGKNIGSVLTAKILELGSGYTQTQVSLTFKTNLILTTVTSNFIVGETVTANDGPTGTVVSFNSTTGLLILKNVSNAFTNSSSIIGNTSFATANISFFSQAQGNISIGSIRSSTGEYFGNTGLISESTMVIQDNKKYQDYSYVLKVARAINEWREDFIKTIHPAGFYFESEIDIQTKLNSSIKVPVVGEISKVIQSPIFEILNTLFLTHFRRKLGTIDDGTTLNLTPLLGKGQDFIQDGRTQFSIRTRDITFKRAPIQLFYLSRLRNFFNSVYVVRGYAYAGSNYGTINREVFRTFARQQSQTNYSIFNLTNIKTSGTGTSLDGNENDLLLVNSLQGRKIKTQLAMPSEIIIQVPQLEFDSTKVTMDQTTYQSGPITFDSTRP